MILSLQLGFAVIPLIHFVSDRGKMGRFAISLKTRCAAWMAAFIIVGLNIRMVYGQVGGWVASRPFDVVSFLVLAICLTCLLLLFYIT
ncbi:MAG: hypothetical protein ACKODS_08130, partial [Methylophilaceae bacterium]